MKTNPFEITIARDIDQSPKTTGVPQGRSIKQYLRQRLANETLPNKWLVKETTVNELVQRRTLSPITVIDMKSSPKRLYSTVLSLAATQRMSPDEAGFLIFSCHYETGKPISGRVNLFGEFPEPAKIEFVDNDKEMESRIDDVLDKFLARKMQRESTPARHSPLDAVREVVRATQDLRESNGNLSAKKVATLFGLSVRRLAELLDRTPQTVSKTPDANSLQGALGYFERTARLRIVLKSDVTFRKWLRMQNASLGDRKPLDFLLEKKWQALTDFVDDILTGSPS